MGGRGSFIDVKHDDFSFVENGQKYHTIGVVDKVKIIVKDPKFKESVNQPYFSHSPNSVYATVQDGLLKYITFYGSDHKIVKEIDLQHRHEVVMPHKHPNGNHTVYEKLTKEENELVDKIKKICGLK